MGGMGFGLVLLHPAMATGLLTLPLVGSLSNTSILQKAVPDPIQTKTAQLVSGEPADVLVQDLLKGEKLLESGQYPAAILVFQQAIQNYTQAGQQQNIPSIQLSLAKAYLLQGDYAAALPIFEAQARDTPYLNSLLGLTYYQMGRYLEAEKILRQTITQWDALLSRPDQDDRDRITLIDQMAYAYRLLQKTLVAQRKTDSALEIAELGRARALVELLSQRYPGQLSPPLPLAQLQQIAKTQRSTLVQYAIVGREMRVLGIEPRDETDLYIWVIQPNGRILFRTVNFKALGLEAPRQLVQLMRGTVLRRSRFLERQSQTNPGQQQLQQLYRLLIAPIADLLPQNPQELVTFIPEGALLLVPFAALQDAAGNYLISQHPIRIAPSLQVLALTHQQYRAQRFAPTGAALVVGNPRMPSLPGRNGAPSELLSPLPASEEEAREIAKLLKSPFLTGSEATKRDVVTQMPEAGIIHLATHGLLDIDANLNEFGELKALPVKTARDSAVFIHPGVIIGNNVRIGNVPAELAAAREQVIRVEIPGVLAFAPTDQDSGFLSAKEILTLRLKAKLAVLSACNTGRGRITGDGIVGLSRAFMGAGVPSVIVSQWSVPDVPTAALMLAFYQNLQRGKNYAEALQQAMLKIQVDFPQPLDWAGFTLVGEAEAH